MLENQDHGTYTHASIGSGPAVQLLWRRVLRSSNSLGSHTVSEKQGSFVDGSLGRFNQNPAAQRGNGRSIYCNVRKISEHAIK